MLFSTDPHRPPETIIETYARRWALEVAFRDAKQLMGFERSQARTPKAVKRTGPFAFAAYTVTVAWFAQYGYRHYPDRIPKRPWYRHKQAPSFADMLHILQTLLREKDFSHTLEKAGLSKNADISNVHQLSKAA